MWEEIPTARLKSTCCSVHIPFKSSNNSILIGQNAELNGDWRCWSPFSMMRKAIFLVPNTYEEFFPFTFLPLGQPLLCIEPLEWVLTYPNICRGNIQQRDLLFNIIKSKHSMMDTALNRDAISLVQKLSDNEETEAFYVELTGATVTADSSVNLIYRYCEKLPKDKYG